MSAEATHSRTRPLVAGWLGEARDARWVALVWGLAFFNVLPVYTLPTLVEIPRLAGQVMTQGALVLAFALALTLNPRVLVRPNAFLLLLTGLAVVALMVSLHNEFVVGSTYRAFRFLLMIATMWLLTPAWGRRDNLLLKAHVVVLTGAIGLVLLGLVLAPDAALSYNGRLSGALWPMPPTQVAHYAAVLLGIVLIFWLTGRLGSWWAGLALLIPGGVLVATHTRTATAALVAGLAVAVASLFLGHARVRRVSALGLAAMLGAGLVFGPLIGSWLLRGQSLDDLSRLTGRTLVWSEVVELDRGPRQTLVGSGLTNGSFDGLPIDSSWVTTYLDQGLLGITVHVLVFVVLLVTAAFRPRSPERAVALFLIVYVLVASFTENALNTPTTYLLDLIVAASLIARPSPPGHQAGASRPRTMRGLVHDATGARP